MTIMSSHTIDFLPSRLEKMKWISYISRVRVDVRNMNYLNNYDKSVCTIWRNKRMRWRKAWNSLDDHWPLRRTNHHSSNVRRLFSLMFMSHMGGKKGHNFVHDFSTAIRWPFLHIIILSISFFFTWFHLYGFIHLRRRRRKNGRKLTFFFFFTINMYISDCITLTHTHPCSCMSLYIELTF